MNKKFKVSDLFRVVSGETTNPNDYPIGNTPYISATEENNGVSYYIDTDPTFQGNLITISRNGSICEVFYQPVPFCASKDDIRILIPKNFELNKYIAFYICALLRKEKFRYTYGRKFGTKRIADTEIKLPKAEDGSPNWETIESLIKQKIKSIYINISEPIEGKFDFSPITEKKFLLDTYTWKKFKYEGKNGVFVIKGGYYNKKPEHTENGNIPFIGASGSSNGITDYYSLYDVENSNKDERGIEHPLSSKIFKGNCITVVNNGASVGSAFYQETEFTCSHDINILYLKNRECNKYIALFICALIQLEKYRWTYGRKWRPIRMRHSEIRLPVNSNGEIDWDFMENYIKGLPYSRSLEPVNKTELITKTIESNKNTNKLQSTFVDF